MNSWSRSRNPDAGRFHHTTFVQIRGPRCTPMIVGYSPFEPAPRTTMPWVNDRVRSWCQYVRPSPFT